ncbi:MAG: sigma 54 modulation/S30EA ribosomal C-terminal domain-containing protein [Acidimicrobiales bacterium]
MVKTKRFPIAEMATDEAALQMDLLNHDFYVFRNVESGLGAVVYRREDGDLGLIEVE